MLLAFTRTSMTADCDGKTVLINPAYIVRVTEARGGTCISQDRQQYDIWVAETVDEVHAIVAAAHKEEQVK